MSEMNLDLVRDELDKTTSKRITLRGKTVTMDSFRIPLELLQYNKLNDRIATFITEYIDERGELPENIELMNSIIQKFIISTSEDTFNRTKNNIRAIGQTEPAVVLSNGIVIDGNRRFTVLRSLYEETGKQEFKYLDAVILPHEKYTDKDIKRLELNLQHAIEGKVTYNAIERLVGIYRDLIEVESDTGKPMFTIEEYHSETLIEKSKIYEDVEIAKLMVEYLKFINQSGKFHFARNMKLDGPLREIHKIAKSKKVSEDKDEVIEALFLVLSTASGDITREIRKLKPILHEQHLREKFMDNLEDSLDDINEVLHSDNFTAQSLNTGIVELPTEHIDKVSDIVKENLEDYNFENARVEPIEVLQKSLSTLERVDTEAISFFDHMMKTQVIDTIEKMTEIIQDIKDRL